MEKKNLHKDHRQRVRSRYLADGIKTMEEHNILELLLFYGIPYKDTNNIAHELIERFGDLNGVLDSSVEELMQVDGIGENAAALIHLTRDIALRYNESCNKSTYVFLNTNDRIAECLRLKYAGESREIVYVVSLDAHGNIGRCVKVCEGTLDSVNVDNRQIIEAVVRQKYSDIVLAHNHPNGFAVPSMTDVVATEKLIPLLKAIGVNLIDHMIFADSEYYSMAQSKKYKKLFE